MLFNSLDFAVFLPLVFLLYWLVFQRSLRAQNVFIVAASFLFYGWWDYRFLALIAFSIGVDYAIGRLLAGESDDRRRKGLLVISLLVNLGFLGCFKYYNFFAENFSAAFSLLGTPISVGSLDVILPVGISFYTFQTLSYTIDVYRGKLEPTRSIIDFAAYVSFFPQLVAGPIERATHLLPQFQRPRRFNYGEAVDGLRQILWGLVKKVVIADSCAQFANGIFENSGSHSGSTLLLGGLFFTFQIYGDFSGYSDIAIGTSRLFGFDLRRNFAFPYFSRDIAEFWRRWHISLSTWFRDYLYIPLGGSRGGKWMKIRNTFAIFLVSGFWHGANWTFLVWGFLNALYFLPLLLSGRNRNNLGVIAEGRVLPAAREFAGMLTTFGLTVVAWIVFRADSMTQVVEIFSEIGSRSLLTVPNFPNRHIAPVIALLIVLFLVVEWAGRETEYGLQRTGLSWSSWSRRSFYLSLVVLVLLFSGQQQSFIYFQF